MIGCDRVNDTGQVDSKRDEYWSCAKLDQRRDQGVRPSCSWPCRKLLLGQARQVTQEFNRLMNRPIAHIAPPWPGHVRQGL